MLEHARTQAAGLHGLREAQLLARGGHHEAQLLAWPEVGLDWLLSAQLAFEELTQRQASGSVYFAKRNTKENRGGFKRRGFGQKALRRDKLM